MDFKHQRILVVAPHTDDGELGCGATIAKALEAGAEVRYVAFSTAKESVPPGMPENILEIEVRQATQRLGIDPKNLYVFGYTVRKLNYMRQEVLEDLFRIRTEVNPTLVFIPSLRDVHQDHSTVAMEAVRAFKNHSVLCYELPWNNIDFSNQCFSVVTKAHLERKVEALATYKSQKMRKYMARDFVFGLARTRGVQAGVEYAEVFEVVRWIM